LAIVISAAETSASKIAVRETLDLIDGRFMATAAGVGRRRYALWVGSGISRDRLVDVGRMLEKALEHLRSRVQPHSDDCRFRPALKEALRMVPLSEAEMAAIRYDDPFATWPTKSKILQALWTQYANVLDIRVQDEPADYMLWSAVDVRATFAGVVDPDCEHLWIAILIMEGAVADIASANWDGLIETAVERLSGGMGGLLQVVVDPERLRGDPGRTRLLKFHGCAVLAARDPEVYRNYLVGSQSQLTEWPNDPVWTAMRNELVNLIVRSPTLMIGLSTQDTNIQHIFSAAKNTMPWAWPNETPAYVFSNDALGQFHRNLLKCVYRNAYETRGNEIEDSALLRAYGKQVLVALTLHVLTLKLIELLPLAPLSTFLPHDRARFGGGLVHLRNRAAEQAGAGSAEFIWTFIRMWSRALSLFRDGVTPANPAHYQRLGQWALHEMAGDPGIARSGLPELAIGLGLLGDGEAEGQWKLMLPPETTGRGAISVVSLENPAQSADIYFVGTAGAAIQLLSHGAIGDENEDVVVVHSEHAFKESFRSPSSAPGRTGQLAPRHVSVRDLVSESADFFSFRERFRERAVL
jgi:hypothetical protein